MGHDISMTKGVQEGRACMVTESGRGGGRRSEMGY